MDPVSIAAAVGPTLKVLYSVTTTLYSFITSAKKVDKSLENLNGEVRGLTRVLEDIETFLKDVIIAQTSQATSRKDGVWGPIYNAIQDTRRTIEALQVVLGRLGPPSKVTNGFKKTVKQIQLGFNSDEINEIKSRVQWHSTILQMALQTATLAINCLTNDNVINVVNPKLDSILPLVSRVESLMKQVEKLSSQLTTIQDKFSKDIQGPDRIEYTQQLTQNAKTMIATASTVINSQSTILDGKNGQRPASSISGVVSKELRLREVEEWISRLTIDHDELAPKFDSISELMPGDSVSCIDLNENRRSQQGNEAGTPRPSSGTGKNAGTPKNMNTKEQAPMKHVSEETLMHTNIDEEFFDCTEGDSESDEMSGNVQTECQACLNMNSLYDEESSKNFLSTFMKTRNGKEWTFNDALLKVAKLEAGQDVRSSANIVGTILYLLEKGAQINVRDAEGSTALHHASMGGNTAMLDFLVKQSADINVINKNGRAALHLAAKSGHTLIVEILLNNGADVDEKSGKSRCTALSIAAYNGRILTVGYLLKAGALVGSSDIQGWTPLHYAAASGHFEVVKVLLKAGAPVHAENNLGQSSLHVAAGLGHVEVVEMLLKAGALLDSINKNGRTPLIYAAYYRHSKSIELLLAAGANIGTRSKNGQTVLHEVLCYKHPEDCKKDLRAICAASETLIDIVKLLCENGADPSAEADNGTTVLSWIRSSDDFTGSERRALIKLLMEYGAK